MRSLWRFLFAMLFLATPASLRADLLDFEGLADLEAVTTQFPGLVFSNATALKSGSVGGSLNEIDFPPFSGVTVVIDDGGPLSILFTDPAASFGGRFTYTAMLQLQAFDSLNQVVASTTSAFANNTVLSGAPGSSPNELLQVSFLAGFSKITITGDALGGSFTLDDAVIMAVITPALVPEPSTLALFLAGTAALAVGRQRRPWRK